MASTHNQKVSLRIPARKPFAAVTTVAALSLAKRLGMPANQLNDLAVVIDQAMLMLLDGLERPRTKGQHKKDPHKKDLHIDLVFRVAESRFDFEVAPSANAGPVPAEAMRRFSDTSGELFSELKVDRKTGIIRATMASAAIR